MGLKETVQLVAARRVGQVIIERADGGEQRLIDLCAGSEARFLRNFGPPILRAHGSNLRVIRIRLRRAPGERLGNAYEGMKCDEDALEAMAISVRQRLAERGISEVFWLH